VNGGSGYFDGTGDYLTAPDDADFDFGSGAFTIECWYYKMANANQALVDTRSTSSNGYLIWPESDGTVSVDVAGSSRVLNGTIAFPLNAWTHLVFVKDGSNNFASFVNGARDDLDTATTTLDAATSFTIGAKSLVSSGVVPITGYLSGFRVVKGAAEYDPTSSTITVPTAPLTAITDTELLCNFTNAGIFDNTGKNNLETVGNAQVDTTTKQFGTGSMEFDGTGDYLLLPNTDNFAFGTGDFTIEFFLYANNVSGAKLLFDVRTALNQVTPALFLDDDQIKLTVNGTVRITSGTISSGTFYHVAVCRSGSSTRMFLDGTQTGSTYTDTNNYLCPGPLNIGRYPVGNNSFHNGFIDELRVTKAARYTSAFTPPTKAFPDS
jgi:hypothetical protein